MFFECGNFNIVLAKKVGLVESVYINEIILQCTDNDFFIVDRNKIFNRTSITEKQQLEIDDCLKKIGIVDKKDEKIKINNETIESIILDTHKTLVNDIHKIINEKSKKMTKEEAILYRLKQHAKILILSDKVEKECENWIDELADSGHKITKTLIDDTISYLYRYCNNNEDMVCAILHKASLLQYERMQFVIELMVQNNEFEQFEETEEEVILIPCNYKDYKNYG